MLGVDLQPDALHAGGIALVRFLIVLRQIVRLRQPLIQLRRAGAADQGEDMEQRNGAGAIARSPWGAEVSQM